MGEGLARARDAASRNDYEAVRTELKKLDPVFRQHIADEESQILGLLVEKLGARGAAEEVKVFQQHRPIYQLMKKVDGLASMSASELEAKQAELKDLFDRQLKQKKGRSNPEGEVVSVQLRRFDGDGNTLERVALYRAKDGTYSELPERTPTQTGSAWHTALTAWPRTWHKRCPRNRLAARNWRSGPSQTSPWPCQLPSRAWP